ncbi:MAG: hypothetical protein JW722_03525 [Demequinaceae bacterium]|nr:hypothetical protein [Demequinaceae bacterium]
MGRRALAVAALAGVLVLGAGTSVVFAETPPAQPPPPGAGGVVWVEGTLTWGDFRHGTPDQIDEAFASGITETGYLCRAAPRATPGGSGVLGCGRWGDAGEFTWTWWGDFDAASPDVFTREGVILSAGGQGMYLYSDGELIPFDGQAKSVISEGGPPHVVLPMIIRALEDATWAGGWGPVLTQVLPLAILAVAFSAIVVTITIAIRRARLNRHPAALDESPHPEVAP